MPEELELVQNAAENWASGICPPLGDLYNDSNVLIHFKGVTDDILTLALTFVCIRYTWIAYSITDCRGKLWPRRVDSRLQSESSLVSKWL